MKKRENSYRMQRRSIPPSHNFNSASSAEKTAVKVNLNLCNSDLGSYIENKTAF